MSWTHLDDRWWSHPKILKAGNAGAGAWARLLNWSRGAGTDGHIPFVMARTIASASRLAALVRLRLLDEAPDGYRIHDYHVWNRTQEEESARKAERSEKRSLAGKNGAAARWGKAQQDGKPMASDMASAMANASQVPWQTDGKVDGTGDGKNMALTFPSLTLPNQEEKIPLGAAAPRRRHPRPAKESKPEATPPEGDQAVVAAYFDAFERAKGARPVFTTRTGKAVKTLLALMPEADVVAAIGRAFADPWFVSTAGELWNIAAEPNRWRGAASGVMRAYGGKPIIQAYSPPSGPPITDFPPPDYDFGQDDVDADCRAAVGPTTLFPAANGVAPHGGPETPAKVAPRRIA